MNDHVLQRYADCGRIFSCPICQNDLALQGQSLYCPQKHCFDIARQGYVNLALGTGEQKNYDKQSFKNRQIILEHGFYDHILAELTAILQRLDTVKTLLDAGCGEGFYARELAGRTAKEVIGFDISRESIALAAKSDTACAVKWFVGDLTHLPLQEHSIDCVLNIFSPANYEEFHRVLTDGGYLIKVIPGNDHLREFREKAREQLHNKEYANAQVITHMKQHFTVLGQKTLTATYPLSPEDRAIFAAMTPLFFHVDQQKIDWTGTDTLTIAAEILIGQ